MENLKNLRSGEELKFIAKSTAETEEIAINFADTLVAGNVVGMDGELGAGKTFFVQKVANALNCQSIVTSPTFVILNEYAADFPIFHFDLYRIKTEQELENIGFTDFLNRKGIVFIEWFRIAKPLLPNDLIRIKFNIIDKNTREIIISQN